MGLNIFGTFGGGIGVRVIGGVDTGVVDTGVAVGVTAAALVVTGGPNCKPAFPPLDPGPPPRLPPREPGPPPLVEAVGTGIRAEPGAVPSLRGRPGPRLKGIVGVPVGVSEGVAATDTGMLGGGIGV